MRIAITGGTGFVGRHLAARLDPAQTVVISRRTGVDIDDVDALAAAFAGCDVVVHAAGINREIGDQTFERVHVEGTRSMIAAAERAVRPIPVADFVDVMVAAAEGRIPDPTVAVMGAEELTLGAAVRRVAHVAGRKPLFVALPVWAIRVLAQLTEWTMIVPLVAKAQAQMLAEGVSEVAPPAPEAPVGIRPTHGFSEASIRAALPSAGRFGWSDLRIARWLRSRRARQVQGAVA